MNQQLTQLSNVIACLRTEVNKDLPIQHVAILLAVAKQPGVSMYSLIIGLKMPQGSISRNVKILVEQYGLLYTKRIPNSRKEIAVYPTEKCAEFVAKLCGLMRIDAIEDDCCISGGTIING